MRRWYDFCQNGSVPVEVTREKPIIAIYGPFQTGKSTLLNCLLGRYTALTGKGIATTALTARCRWGSAPRLRYRDLSGDLIPATLEQIHNPAFLKKVMQNQGFHIEADAPAELLKHCQIVDTPGFNACSADTHASMSVLDEIHYVLFVVPNRGFSQAEKQLLRGLARREIPVTVLMNCTQGRREERWMPDHAINREILDENESWLRSEHIPVHPVNDRLIYPCNFLFYWSQQVNFAESLPYIDRPDTVQKHICELLQEEGFSNSPESIIRLSGVPQLKEWLMQKIQGYDPILHKWR